MSADVLWAGRQRIRKTIEHREAEVPIDRGPTAATGIHVAVVEQRRRYCGLEQIPVRVIEPCRMLGEVHDELEQAGGVDLDALYPATTVIGFGNEGWRE
ncbi:MAG: hypothetical protein JW820_19725 [Spirochaetales bacterium]|nr:hypothetical protein [Spirochaetales bacterium]